MRRRRRRSHTAVSAVRRVPVRYDLGPGPAHPKWVPITRLDGVHGVPDTT